MALSCGPQHTWLCKKILPHPSCSCSSLTAETGELLVRFSHSRAEQGWPGLRLPEEALPAPSPELQPGTAPSSLSQALKISLDYVIN